MMTKHTFLFLFLYTAVAFAQQNFVRDGIITLTDSQMLGFTNMTIANEKASFINVATNSRVSYPLAEVSLIEDDSQKVIYKGAAPKPKMPSSAQIVKDTLYRPGYPEGIYKTKEEFVAKKPSVVQFLLPVDKTGSFEQAIADECFFLDAEGDKIKKVFAISYKGCLYFRVGAILEHRNKLTGHRIASSITALYVYY